MFGWLRKAAPVRETAEAMVDPRPGNTMLFLGSSNAALAGSCAAVTGLNGRAVVTGRGADEKKRIEDAAAAAGALIEFVDAPPAMLPLDTDTFDLVVIAQLASASGVTDAAVVAEAVRVARPAGRIIAITGERRAGIFGALQKGPAPLASGTVIAMLKTAGTIAARKLATVDGVSYYETRKPRG